VAEERIRMKWARINVSTYMAGSDHYPKTLLIFAIWKLDGNVHAPDLRLQRVSDGIKEGSLMWML